MNNLEKMAKYLTVEEVKDFFTNEEIERFDTDKSVQDRLKDLEGQKADWCRDVFLGID